MSLFTLRRCAAFFTTLAIAGAGQATPAAPAPLHPAFQVDVTGKGAPVILIPGLASSGEVWQGTVARLCGPAQRRRCHVLSLAGFAGVAPIAGDLLAQAKNQLAAYISDNQLGQPAIIGHSLGGFLALKLAIDHPQQAGKLVIVDALPALGAVQLPSITPEQMRGAMRAGGTGLRGAAAVRPRHQPALAAVGAGLVVRPVPGLDRALFADTVAAPRQPLRDRNTAPAGAGQGRRTAGAAGAGQPALLFQQLEQRARAGV